MPMGDEFCAERRNMQIIFTENNRGNVVYTQQNKEEEEEEEDLLLQWRRYKHSATVHSKRTEMRSRGGLQLSAATRFFQRLFLGA